MEAIPTRRLGSASGGLSPVDKSTTAVEAVRRIAPGDSIMVGGFMDVGAPGTILDELTKHGADDLTIIANDAATPDSPLGRLLLSGLVVRLVTCYAGGNRAVQEMARAGRLELEFIPLGTLLERIRASGAGLGGVLTPTGIGTPIADGNPIYKLGGRNYLVAEPLGADVALLSAFRADNYGNLIYRGTARNFNPVMATAADLVIAEAEQIFEAGDLDPDRVETAGVFVDLILERPA